MGTLRLSAYSTAARITVVMPARVADYGEAIVDAGLLGAYVRRQTKATVSMKGNGSVVALTSTSRLTLPSYGGRSVYPSTVEMDRDAAAPVSALAPEVVSAIGQLAPLALKSDPVPFKEAVRIARSEGGGTAISACDGFVLGLYTHEAPLGEAGEIVLTRPAATALADVADKASSTELWTKESGVFAATEHEDGRRSVMHFASRDVVYPDLSIVTSQERLAPAPVDGAVLRAALERAAVSLAEEGAVSLRLVAGTEDKPGGIGLASSSIEKGSGSMELIETELAEAGEGGTFWCPYQKLKAALKLVGSEVALYMGRSIASPLRLSGGGFDLYVCASYAPQSAR